MRAVQLLLGTDWGPFWSLSASSVQRTVYNIHHTLRFDFSSHLALALLRLRLVHHDLF